jgi:hypothetical protein
MSNNQTAFRLFTSPLSSFMVEDRLWSTTGYGRRPVSGQTGIPWNPARRGLFPLFPFTFPLFQLPVPSLATGLGGASGAEGAAAASRVMVL